jgi:hypothetical protein
MMTSEEFWEMADSIRTKEEYLVDDKLRYLQSAPVEHLRDVFVQYRFFTIYYIGDLALLVHKVPFGKLRSVLGEILNDELGLGDWQKAHPYIYDSFLRSIGVDQHTLENSARSENIQLLEELRQLMLTSSAYYAIGLRGMGGECLCQVQLEAMHKNFMNNPYVKDKLPGIDMLFWDIHAGEEDIHHREMMRESLTLMMRENPSAVEEMATGYLKAKKNFDQFWDNIFTATGAGSGHVVTTDEELAVLASVKKICADSKIVAPVHYKDEPNYFGILGGSENRWFLRAFCDATCKSLVTPLPVEQAALLSPGFEVEPAAPVFGKSRVYISGAEDVERLRALVLRSYEAVVGEIPRH